ncbi:MULTISPECIES: hypothetical protein [unclassified Mesorhizobium]|uniref:hypothetical protein n=1 Tax=unclassified Mesorhizobium TaxID=325217 RepID=UPI001CC94EB5|nr:MULTISPECIES: hypothetical protein [unclassified Mesorhizobium]MBZ9817380.1 hypothetical protein [Mesorhizobium sp. CA7]MBZ9863363.1 hypothetical protein [Mesorhizobium sp. CA12]MBZ9885086.1 hypothetical protein [Mesorhizobium sp. CA10]
MNNAERIADDKVRIEPPAQTAVETLGAIDVGDTDDDGLQLHLDGGPFAISVAVATLIASLLTSISSGWAFGHFGRAKTKTGQLHQSSHGVAECHPPAVIPA